MDKKPILDLYPKVKLSHALDKAYSAGPDTRGKTALGAAYSFLTTTVNTLAWVFEKNGSKIQISLDEVRRKNGSITSISFVIFTGTKVTLVPLKLTETILHIRKQPYYLVHDRAASDVLDALLSEIEAVVEAENKKSQH